MELLDVASRLSYCDWNCVDMCQVKALDLAAKTECISTCGCYEATGPHYFAQPQPDLFAT